MNRGYTLLEVLVVLALIGVSASVVADGMGRFGRDLSARITREEIVALIDGTRVEGRSRGGASLVLRRDGGYAVTSDGSLLRSGLVELPSSEALRLPGGRDSVVVRFDRLGIGRMASTTITVVAGSVERSVVLSSYGRVRRR